MARVELADAAARDLAGIRDYTREHWGAARACDYLRDLRLRMHWLADGPLRGRDRGEHSPGLRSYPEGSHLIFYRQTKTGIEVARILHARMELSRQLSDPKLGAE